MENEELVRQEVRVTLMTMEIVRERYPKLSYSVSRRHDPVGVVIRGRNERRPMESVTLAELSEEQLRLDDGEVKSLLLGMLRKSLGPGVPPAFREAKMN